MTRDETIALFLECEDKRRQARAAALARGTDTDSANAAGQDAARAHWNAWANGLLGQRKAMEADGRWAAEKGLLGHFKPKNDETQAWFEQASVNFSRCLFLPRGTGESGEATGADTPASAGAGPQFKTIEADGRAIRFDGFVFPGGSNFASAAFGTYADFGNATFAGYVFFARAAFNANAGFGGAAFRGGADFGNAACTGAADFRSASFSGHAEFGSASFGGNADFENAAFGASANFLGASFGGSANFQFATFEGGAHFGNAAFGGSVHFASCTFRTGAYFKDASFGAGAYFPNAAFLGDATFESAVFGDSVSFGGASYHGSASYLEVAFKGEANFAGAKVERAFDMTGAMFGHVPAFNQADFKQAPNLDGITTPSRPFWPGGSVELAARYRALRRMAIQGADYEREQMAFKGELRSRRWTLDKPWSAGMWIGAAYDLFSDCGRSIIRPLLCWLGSILGFAILYTRLADQGGHGWTRCVEEGGVPFLKALFLSGRNAMVLFSGGRDERILQAYRCLYGGADAGMGIPDRVSFLEAFVQVPLSAVLIFLMLLAIKNRFKIK